MFTKLYACSGCDSMRMEDKIKLKSCIHLFFLALSIHSLRQTSLSDLCLTQFITPCSLTFFSPSALYSIRHSSLDGCLLYCGYMSLHGCFQVRMCQPLRWVAWTCLTPTCFWACLRSCTNRGHLSANPWAWLHIQSCHANTITATVSNKSLCWHLNHQPFVLAFKTHCNKIFCMPLLYNKAVKLVYVYCQYLTTEQKKTFQIIQYFEYFLLSLT